MNKEFGDIIIAVWIILYGCWMHMRRKWKKYG